MKTRPNAQRSIGTIATVGADWRASSRQDWRRRDMRSEVTAWPNNKEAMRPLNYEVMFDVEDNHWWFVGRRAIVFSQIEDALGTTHAAARAKLSPETDPSQTERAGMRALQRLRVLDI